MERAVAPGIVVVGTAEAKMRGCEVCWLPFWLGVCVVWQSLEGDGGGTELAGD